MNISYFITADVLFPLLKKYGYGIELTRFISKEILDNYKIYLSETISEVLGIEEVMLHAPFDNLSACSSDRYIIEETNKYYQLIYQLAQALGAKGVVYHTSYEPNVHNFTQALKQSVTFWSGFLKGKDDIMFYIENVMEQDYHFQLELYKQVNRPNFKICLDVGHVNKNSISTIVQWIKELNSAIAYVHLHNNNGVNDEHNAINDGSLNMGQTLECLLTYAPNATWSLETEGVQQSLNWLNEHNYK